MKHSDSTEMDRLLRRYARRNGETLPHQDEQSDEAQGPSGSPHMDADELSAYAEGALPEVARSRYFTHLADCDTCRKLVTELTLASGTVSEVKRAVVAEVTPSRSWREWLRALLSPAVLRYAVPALALFGVILVAVVMMRTRSESSLVSQNNQIANNSSLKSSENSNSVAGTSSTNTSASVENHPNSNISSSNAAAPQPSPQSETRPGVLASATPVPKTDAAQENTPLASSSDAPKPVVGQAGSNDKKQGTFAEEGKNRDAIAGAVTTPEQPSPPPPAKAASPAAGADDNINKREEQTKRKASEKDTDETAVVVTDSAGNTATVSKTASNEMRRGRGERSDAPSAPNLAAKRGSPPRSEPVDAVTEKERPADMRSIGGRQFRRQGNVWVDTAYNSSRSTINVARGSEQYRALVADEPGLRTITQQLGGEVIVVWKSRAYRFY